jgi:hypothetical protein
MDTNEAKLSYKDDVSQVVGRARENLNALGYDTAEKPYQHALIVEHSVYEEPHFNSSPPSTSVADANSCLLVSIRGFPSGQDGSTDVELKGFKVGG